MHEKNDNFSEDLHEVNEEVEGVGDEVLVPAATLLDDHLGVVDDKAAEDGESDPESSLKDQLGAHEDVKQSHPEECGHGGHEGAAQVEVVAVGGEEGGPGEAGKDHGGEEESVGNDPGVDADGHVQKGAGAEA